MSKAVRSQSRKVKKLETRFTLSQGNERLQGKLINKVLTLKGKK